MQSNRIKSLDGLKGLSILAVILYHLWPNFVPGGFFYVNAFLVFGGYFLARKIQDLSFNQWKTNTLRLIQKQLARLWIPLLWLMAIIVSLYLIINPTALKSMRNDILASLFFFNNFFQLASDKSYFTDMALASPFTHLWYVAIYVQSFIVSLILLLINRWFSERIWEPWSKYQVFFWLAIVFICHGAYWQLYRPNTDPSNVYYGLFTRYGSFATGIFAYFLFPELNKLFRHLSSRKSAIFITLIGTIALFDMLLMTFSLNDNHPWTYQMGLAYFDLLTLVFLFANQRSNKFFESTIGNPGLTYIGKASYSFYLCYYPITVLAFSLLRLFQGQVILLKIICFISIFMIGSLFYYFIESKRFTYLFGNDLSWIQDLKTFGSFYTGTPGLLTLARSFIFWGLCMALGYGIAISKNDKPLALFQLEYGNYQADPSPLNFYYPYDHSAKNLKDYLSQVDKTLGTHFILPVQTRESPVELALKEDPRQRIDLASLDISEENQAIIDELAVFNPIIAESLTPLQQVYALDAKVTLFGDSLAKLNGPAFVNLFRSSNFFGYVSMQVWDADEKLAQLIQEGVVNDTLVINIGTNAGLDEEGISDLIKVAGDRQIYLVTTNSAVEHLKQVNDIISWASQTYPNVHVIDWHAIAQGHPEYYDIDDIHLSIEGMEYFVSLVAKDLYQDNFINNITP